jgi:hypothetical protein
MLLVIAAFFAVSGAARQFGGAMWASAGEAVVPCDDGVMVQLLQQMYLQRLGAGPSCGTHHYVTSQEQRHFGAGASANCREKYV